MLCPHPSPFCFRGFINASVNGLGEQRAGNGVASASFNDGAIFVGKGGIEVIAGRDQLLI